jgi:L-lactate dehydrogenase complex protein LldG
MSSDSRNNILKKIRQALATPTPMPFPQSERNESVFQPQTQDPVLEFAEEFTKLQGKFIFCSTEVELIENFGKLCYQNQWSKVFCSEPHLHKFIQPNLLYNDLSSCEAAVTTCEVLVARTGSMVLASVHQGRLPSVYAPIHVCFAYSSQIVYDIKDALEAMKNKYQQFLPSLITFATGPSRTADIEKTLVVGVHGPKEVYCFVIDDKQ